MATKKLKVGNVPNLRFKEFEGEWVERKLKELSENGFSNGAFNDPKKVGSGYRIINVKDMYVAGTINVNSLTRVNIDENEFSKNRVEFGDIFFTRSSLVKEGIAYSNVNLSNAEDLTFDGHLIRMRPNKTESSSIYLYYNFTTSKIRKQLIERGKTTTMTTIGQEDIATVIVAIPTLPEQQKIASFLTSIDERISTQSKIIEQLETLIKGLREELLSQQLRFKDADGKSFAKWEKKKLGDIGETYNGLTGKTKESFGAGKPYIQYMQIFDDSKIDTSRFGLVEVGEQENQNKVLFGDVFFTISSETSIDIGTASVLLDEVDELYLNSFCFGFRANSLKTLSPYFARYLFRSKSFRNDIVKLAQGSTRYNMSKVQLMKLSVLLPCLKEQTKIANLLSMLNQKIDMEKVLLQQLEKQKQFLLQNLFI